MDTVKQNRLSLEGRQLLEYGTIRHGDIIVGPACDTQRYAVGFDIGSSISEAAKVNLRVYRELPVAVHLDNQPVPTSPPKTSAVKHDDDKPAIALLPAEAIEEIAKVFTFGAKKYDTHNWRGGFTYTRILSAVLRHTFSFLRGEDNDKETGLSHLAHAICGLMFCLTYVKTRTDLDDRFKASV